MSGSPHQAASMNLQNPALKLPPSAAAAALDICLTLKSRHCCEAYDAHLRRNPHMRRTPRVGYMVWEKPQKAVILTNLHREATLDLPRIIRTKCQCKRCAQRPTPSSSILVGEQAQVSSSVRVGADGPHGGVQSPLHVCRVELPLHSRCKLSGSQQWRWL